MVRVEEAERYSLVKDAIHGFGDEVRSFQANVELEDSIFICKIVSVNQPRNIAGHKWLPYDEVLSALRSAPKGRADATILVAAIAMYKKPRKPRRKS